MSDSEKFVSRFIGASSASNTPRDKFNDSSELYVSSVAVLKPNGSGKSTIVMLNTLSTTSIIISTRFRLSLCSGFIRRSLIVNEGQKSFVDEILTRKKFKQSYEYEV